MPTLIQVDGRTSSASTAEFLRVRVVIDADGEARARGPARLQDGTSNTILVAERSPARASCADADADGAVGLTGVELVFRDVRTGARLTAAVVPDGGEIDGRGPHPVTIRLGDTSIPGVLRVRGRFG